MILSLAAKHRKNLIAPSIAGGIIYSCSFFEISAKIAAFAPIASEVLVILFFSWCGVRTLKRCEKEETDADKKIKDNLDGELDYFTKIIKNIPETSSEAKKTAEKHIGDLIKMRAEHSKCMHEKLDAKRSEASANHKKSKEDLLELENDMDEQLGKISSAIADDK